MNIKESEITLCLCTHNEELNVEYVIDLVKEHFKSYVFIVDGFSTDNTVELAEGKSIDVFKREHKGKGSAIQKALNIAESKGYKYLLILDCDRTYHPEDILKLLEFDNSYDLIIGVRDLNLIQPNSRKWGNHLVTGIMNFTFNGQIEDSISGFKCMKVARFNNKLNTPGFVYDALICVWALKKKMKIGKVPISYDLRVGESKMGLIVGFPEFIKYIYYVLKFRFF